MFGRDRIKLDRPLFEKVLKYSRVAGYASPDEFVKHVLEREIAKFEVANETEDEIRRRMQGLGYLS